MTSPTYCKSRPKPFTVSQDVKANVPAINKVRSNNFFMVVSLYSYSLTISSIALPVLWMSRPMPLNVSQAERDRTLIISSERITQCFMIKPWWLKDGYARSDCACIYFGNQGEGVYFGIGLGTLNTDIVFKDLTFEEDGNQGTGEGKASSKISTTNLKLGIKTGGKVYFRLELGYGIGSIPNSIEVTGEFTYEDSNGLTQTDSGTETEEFPPIPGVSSGGVLVGNFGFGISF